MIGGMEQVSYHLGEEFKKNLATHIIAWKKSQKWLPWFFVKALGESFFVIFSKNITHIHLADGLLSPLGVLLKYVTRKKVTVTVHGLDIIYPNTLYQFFIPRFLKRLDKVICASTATKKECCDRGISEDKCVVIPWGVDPKEFYIEATRKDLEKFVKSDLQDKKVLVTVGRLIQRKGVCWFLENVFLALNDQYVYLIVGSGPDRVKIKKIIYDLHLSAKVFLLGNTLAEELKIIYNTADFLVMPNILVEGDMEGFGIVAIEAGSAGLPVIAADREGIRDVVIDGRTGKLAANEKIFQDFLNNPPIFNKKEIQRIIEEKFSWSRVAHDYIVQLQNLL